MKETVTKTAKKAAAAMAEAPAVAASATKAKAKPASRPAPTAASAKKPAAGAAKAKPAATKTVAAKQAPAAKAKAPSARKAAGAGSEEMAARSSAHNPAVPGAAAGLADKMKTSVVSKVSEVMTKTTKPNTAAHAEQRILTEEEIRAMRDEDYMNPAQLAFFKDRLQQLEKELLKNAGETTEHLRETVLVPDPADRATIEEEHALELRTRDRERKLLKKVQQSLAAIDGGEYGWCEETGEPIGIPRLIARPTATLSLEAQQRRELKQKLYGD